jgi:hypothetical protein
MNSYWHVAQTYLWRPRFWFWTGFAAFVCLLWWFNGDPTDGARRAQSILSALFASVGGCFVALHARRQFGTAAARLLPDFAPPHLAIAAVVSLALWVGVPLIGMWAAEWPRGSLAIHAVAGILIGLTACWPRALLLLAALPVLLIWATRENPGGPTLLVALSDGDRPLLANVLITLSALLNLAAAVVLLRLPRQGITTNDELGLEPNPVPNSDNRLGELVLRLRDRAAARLGDARLLRSVQRWRVPVAVSWFSLLVPVVVVVLLTLLGGLFDDLSDWATMTALITSSVLLISPLGPWHTRRAALGLEFMRPVTRQAFFRQVLLALAGDFCLWTLLSTTIGVVVFAIVPPFRNVEARGPFVLGYVLVIWSMACLVYGVATVTIRWRFWIPVVAAAGVVWCFGLFFALAIIGNEFRHGPVRANMPAAFAVLSFAAGLLLARVGYRRLVAADVA